jgi:hypothetical protein
MNPQVTGQTHEKTEVPEAGMTTERYHFTGEEILSKIKQVVHEGNVRRVLIKNAEGHTIVEFPLTVGVVGAALAPLWAAIGAVVALVVDCTIEIEKMENTEQREQPERLVPRA